MSLRLDWLCHNFFKYKYDSLYIITRNRNTEIKTRISLKSIYCFNVLCFICSYCRNYCFISRIHTQANDSIRKFDTVQKSRESRGIDLALKELKQSNDIVKKLKADDSNLQFSVIIQKVLENKLPDITFSAIQISKSNDKSASSSMEVIVQGKSQSRESLLAFKKNLEANPAILKVDLPISDLAKSKNIAFAFRLLLKKQNEN